jgi:flagellar basal-body rod protein FlgB
MIRGLLDSGALPTLERLVQFTGQRHRVLTQNIANLDTPYFQPRDLDPKAFQASLRDAIDRRRSRPNPTAGPLNMRDTRQLSFKKDHMEAQPAFSNQNIMFHDRNNRDLERIMQSLAENTLAHSAGIEMLRNQFSMLEMAIRGRL